MAVGMRCDTGQPGGDIFGSRVRFRTAEWRFGAAGCSTER